MDKGRDEGRPIWLVSNTASGGNDGEALAALEACCAANRLAIAGRSVLPDDELPTASALDAAGVEIAAVHAGDGTVNALIAGLSGWRGTVLVLPGGTKNLLYHRLFGERTAEEAIAAVARGAAAPRRPGVIRHGDHVAFAEVLAGPGASWGRVREAMRDNAIGELAAFAAEAVEDTLAGEMLACVEPAAGRAEGYPLIALRARDDGIAVAAYYADGAGEYLEQAWAMLTRNFREGPHEVLAVAPRIALTATEGGTFELLFDGEQIETASPAEFRLAACEVDLLATEADGL